MSALEVTSLFYDAVPRSVGMDVTVDVFRTINFIIQASDSPPMTGRHIISSTRPSSVVPEAALKVDVKIDIVIASLCVGLLRL